MKKNTVKKIPPVISKTHIAVIVITALIVLFAFLFIENKTNASDIAPWSVFQIQNR